MTTIGLRPSFSALESTNLVCGMTDSAASTSNTTPSTIDRMRSTSPPKSAWPGVSTMLMRMPSQSTLVHLARMVMPRSRSRSLESMARSSMCWFSRTEPDCLSSWSTSVVLPWSTWAIMAILRISMGRGAFGSARCIDAPLRNRKRTVWDRHAAFELIVLTAKMALLFGWINAAADSCPARPIRGNSTPVHPLPWLAWVAARTIVTGRRQFQTWQKAPQGGFGARNRREPCYASARELSCPRQARSLIAAREPVARAGRRPQPTVRLPPGLCDYEHQASQRIADVPRFGHGLSRDFSARQSAPEADPERAWRRHRRGFGLVHREPVSIRARAA